MFRQQLVFIDAVRNLTNLEIHEKAQEALLSEEKRFSQIRKPTADEVEKSMRIRKEILSWVERDMLEDPDLRSLHATLTSSAKVLEKVEVGKKQLEGLSKRQLGKLKANIAEDLDRQFPPRQTVTGSFRTH